ncbi:MAG: ribosome biogenesis GTPase Der [Bacteroidetes bacterium]|nr:ribosome biogenesis GTPase Der [Bacteroidota bacterium]
MGNIVAIVGRPNVGKSTLFNRITESRKAIVDETAGVTRDRHYGKGEWNGIEFSIIDTGGYIKGSEDIFEEEIRKQVQLAIEEADVILFVVDVFEGVTHYDKEVANILRRSKKKVLLVANKVDSSARSTMAADFYQLGMGDPFAIASISGSGTGDLLDEMVKHITPDEKNDLEHLPKFAIVGRPNVGKSSLLNALIGINRSIVTPIAGTTRDTINTRYNFFGHDFILIDTAGIRKKAKVKEDLEFYSVMRSIKAIEECDVCILMLDATLGVESQDLSIFQLAQTNRKGIVILVNKWDLVEDKENNTVKEFEEKIRAKIAPMKDIPIVFISVLEKQRLMKAIETAEMVYQNKQNKISTSVLNDLMLPLIEHYPPPSIKGKDVRIKFVTQLPGKNPNFAFYCNLPQYINDPYKRFLENKLRDNFNFNGVPIEIVIKKKV